MVENQRLRDRLDELDPAAPPLCKQCTCADCQGRRAGMTDDEKVVAIRELFESAGERDAEAVAPMNQTAQAAVTRALDRLTMDRTVRRGKSVEPTTPLFPSPVSLDRPIDKSRASRWLLRAERLAGLPKIKQGLWHPPRRAWASNRRDLPEKDVAKAGGWSSPDVMKQCYQHATDEGVIAAVQERE